MRKAMKIRLAVFLSIMLVLPTIVSMLPMTATEVSAATKDVSLYWSWDDKKPIQVEKGQKFYVGDYLNVYDSSFGYSVASVEKASYASSKKSVATVKSNGYLKAEKVGTTTITVKCKGKKATTKLEVVPAGTFKKTKAVAGLKKQAEELAKKMPSKITTKNGFSLNKAVATYRTYADGVGGYIDQTTHTMHAGISREGLLEEGITESYTVGDTVNTYMHISKTNKLVVPQAGRYLCLNSMLFAYGRNNSPTSTLPAKMMKVKSISATTSSITVKIKKKLTENQILGARSFEGTEWNGKLTDKKTAYGSEPIYDPKTNEYVGFVKVEMKKGSNTLKLTPMKYEYNNGKSVYVKIKLTKGKTYQLGATYSWGKGKTFTVK